jgi:hypothetical protein
MSGTLLSDLDTSSPMNSSDGDLVQKILNDMNDSPPAPQVTSRQPTPAGSNQIHPSVINSPNPNSIMTHSMDNGPATAHMIGNEHPTNADFASMMHSKQQNHQQWQQYNQPVAPLSNQHYVPKKQWYSSLITELKTPILVSLLFFVFSLPFLNILFAHYIPYLVKGTGELTMIGLLVKSFLAGIVFWIFHRIVAPLLTSS